MSTDRPGTRDRLVDAAAELFSRDGYAATGVKAVLWQARVGRRRRRTWRCRLPRGRRGAVPAGRGRRAATADAFAGAAALLEDFADACPIATIALEVASSDEPMRQAAADGFNSWLAVLREQFTSAGMTAERAADVAVELLCLLEGAFLLARTTRSTAALHTVGRAATASVAAALSAGGEEGKRRRARRPAVTS